MAQLTIELGNQISQMQRPIHQSHIRDEEGKRGHRIFAHRTKLKCPTSADKSDFCLSSANGIILSKAVHPYIEVRSLTWITAAGVVVPPARS